MGLFDGRALKATRLARGWTQRDLVVALDDLEADLDISNSLGVDTSLVSKWEAGKKTPNIFYGLRLCLVFCLPPDMIGLHHLAGRPAVRREAAILLSRLGARSSQSMVDDDDNRTALSEVEKLALTRRTFLQQLTLAAGAAGLAGPLPGAFGLARWTSTDIRDCAQWIAWEMWQHGRKSVHESELPDPVARHLASHLASDGLLLRDSRGWYSFAHGSFVDFFVAQRIASSMSSGRSDLLAGAQTSHETDLVIGRLVATDQARVGSLSSWMVSATNPVLRVNSAGILAKLDLPDVGDDVIRAVGRDRQMRERYLTAVASRVLELDWRQASQMVSALQEARFGSLAGPPQPRSARFAARLASELRNPRDVAARWCSIVLLGSLLTDAREVATPALREALAYEGNAENARAIATVLAGSRPVISAN